MFEISKSAGPGLHIYSGFRYSSPGEDYTSARRIRSHVSTGSGGGSVLVPVELPKDPPNDSSAQTRRQTLNALPARFLLILMDVSNWRANRTIL